MNWLSISLFFACNTQTDPKIQDSSVPVWQPTIMCPGSEGCSDNDGILSVGAASESIVPDCFESWLDCGEDGLCPGDADYVSADSGESDGDYDNDFEVFLDCGCDQLCPGDDGYTAADEGEADGNFHGAWLAGFSNGRPATGVHDPIYARAIVFDQGETRIALVVLDLVGWFYGDVVLTRELLVEQGVELDHLIVSSTHTHEAPDTMGLWGRTPTSGGYDTRYGEQVRQASVDAVSNAILDLQEVGEFTIGSADATTYADNGISNLIRDSRDPKVIDERMGGAIFRNTSGDTIATLSHFGNHPEVLADENTEITSDFPGPLRDMLEDGVQYETSGYEREGYGGTSIFINGSVGGLMTPLGITVVDREGVAWTDYNFEKLDAYGKVLAEIAMDAIDGGTPVSDPKISVVGNRFFLPVENFGFQAMFISGIVDREVFNYDSDEIIDEDNIPYVETEINHFKIGPLSLLTVPGEIVPELIIGGFDGSHVGNPEMTVISESNPNPPDLSLAPQGPYIEELVGNESFWIVGLGNDEIGYILPEYDFKLNENFPWFDEAEGDHYEETNSLGPKTNGVIQEQIELLLTVP